MLKKLADAALQKMHCCIAALAIEKLGGRAQLGCNAGPNLLPWINVHIKRGLKPPPLGQRYMTSLVQTSSLGSASSFGGAPPPPGASPFLFSPSLSYQLRFDPCFAALETALEKTTRAAKEVQDAEAQERADKAARLRRARLESESSTSEKGPRSKSD